MNQQSPMQQSSSSEISDQQMQIYASGKKDQLGADEIATIEAAMRNDPACAARVLSLQAELAAAQSRPRAGKPNARLGLLIIAGALTPFILAAAVVYFPQIFESPDPQVQAVEKKDQNKPFTQNEEQAQAARKDQAKNKENVVVPVPVAEAADKQEVEGVASNDSITEADLDITVVSMGGGGVSRPLVEPRGKTEARQSDQAVRKNQATSFMAIGAAREAGGAFSEMRSASQIRRIRHIQQVPATGVKYAGVKESGFQSMQVKGNDFSTFSIDVDTASYSDVRSNLVQYNQLPAVDSVRSEELINYFNYQYPGPAADSGQPFAYNVESAICPWAPAHRLLRIGLQAKRIAPEQRPAANLVFLIDSSGSMRGRNKLPLLKTAFKMLVQQLDERDKVAIVVYAGSSGVVLPPTSGADKAAILQALDQLRSGGGTNGAGGIQQAYAVAEQMNAADQQETETRVILATDGDFNVGISDQNALVDLIKEKAQHGIFLNIHGYGMNNRQDGTMELMSNSGNGTYAFIDTNREAQKVMVDDVVGSLVTVAKDVKIQCVFNPQQVAAWRLIGYENRKLATADFKNDKKDAGEIGAGHSVTALYEIIPVGVKIPGADIDPSPFVKNPEQDVEAIENAEINPACMQLRLRYKQPQGSVSIPLVHDVILDNKAFAQASESFRWAASVASFAQLLRTSAYAGDSTWEQTIAMAKASRGVDEAGLRAECIRLMETARNMQD